MLYLPLASSLCRMFLALQEKPGRNGGKTIAGTREHTNTQDSFLKQKAENNYDSNWSGAQVFIFSLLVSGGNIKD